MACSSLSPGKMDAYQIIFISKATLEDSGADLCLLLRTMWHQYSGHLFRMRDDKAMRIDISQRQADLETSGSFYRIQDIDSLQSSKLYLLLLFPSFLSRAWLSLPLPNNVVSRPLESILPYRCSDIIRHDD